MCQPRAHRPALDTRTALTETLLLADNGGLDRTEVERLLQLSFYPVGSAVELADGSLAVVVATHPYDGTDTRSTPLDAPARPVVAVLTDAQGQLLSGPRHIDLGRVEGKGILRGIPAHERCQRLGWRFGQWTTV